MLQNFFHEIRLTCPLHHGNIIACYGGCWLEDASLLTDEESLSGSFKSDFGCNMMHNGPITALVLELAARGDLAGYITKGLFITEGILAGLARALAYLHSWKVRLIHRDLKPESESRAQSKNGDEEREDELERSGPAEATATLDSILETHANFGNSPHFSKLTPNQTRHYPPQQMCSSTQSSMRSSPISARVERLPSWAKYRP